MHHTNARDHREVMAVEIEVNFVLQEARNDIAAAIGVRLHNLAISAWGWRLG